MRRAWWIVGLMAVLGAVALAPFPEPARALAAAPATLLLPGLPWARAGWRRTTDRLVAAVWISVLAAIPAVALARLTHSGGFGVFAVGLAVAAVGTLRPALRREAAPVGQAVGLGAVGLAVLLTTIGNWRELQRPLDGWWWFGPAETAWEESGPSVPPGRGAGWAAIQPLGWKEAGAIVFRPKIDRPYLLGPAHGPLVVALRGPVGATIEVGKARARIESDPTVDPEEGPVPRYQDRGVAGLVAQLDLDAGERVTFTLSDPLHSLVYLLPTPEAVWSLHASGALRHAHYYQLLNMVEQLRWADELGVSRWVTDVQPPLWSWALAAPLTTTDGGQPTANVLLMLLLGAIGAAGLAAIGAFAPHAPLPAWLLPAALVPVHARLLLEPGSASLPDSLYTLAILGGVAAVGARRSDGVAGFGLLAQLARYPGTLVVGVAAALDGQWRAVRGLLGVVLVAMAGFGLAGLVSGSLGAWLDTVWWETGPEHWHGESSPAALLARVPAFYGHWLGYAGGLPLLAAVRWPRGTRVVLGTAFVYSLLLCTIDHSPSHYFLPLVQLAGVAAACTAGALPSRWGWLLSVVGLGGVWISTGLVAVTG